MESEPATNDATEKRAHRGPGAVGVIAALHLQERAAAPRVVARVARAERRRHGVPRQERRAGDVLHAVAKLACICANG